MLGRIIAESAITNSAMKPTLTQIALAVTLLAFNSIAFAQDASTSKEAPAPVVPAKPIAKVEIKGSTEEYDARREDTASKTVLTNAEIIKYGDTNVYDVLKRAPGVTVIGNTIRMRGLGAGYTQIMVNGERPPPGFSMDALAPDQIEKIEVIRAATAEHSMQAVAGSINIILKKVVAKAQRDLRINTSHAGEQRNTFIMGTLADRTGNLSYYLNAMLGQHINKTPGFSTDLVLTPDGQVVQLRDKRHTTSNRSTNMGVQPRLNWKLANDDQLNASGYLQMQRTENGSTSLTSRLEGSFPASDYADWRRSSEGRGRYAGVDLNWIAKLGGGKLDAKLSVSGGRFENGYRSVSSTLDRAIKLQRDADSTTRYSNASSTGKYTRSLFEGHALATGWEVTRNDNDDDSVRVEGLFGTQPLRIPERFNPTVTRLAAYIQDEWNITKDWSMYQGVRWEGIRTRSVGTGLLSTESRNHVLSPVAQTLYKFPDKSGRQLRMALTRTFKAPQTHQLSARRNLSDMNTRFQPDYSGNPELRPELANGVDLTYEHFWAPGAVFSVSGSARHIKDYIRSKLTQDRSGYWLVLPLNDGKAQVRTFEMELKFPLKTVMKDAPAVDLRASVSRNWSKVESVPGPDNTLDQQVPLSAVLGADYKADKYSAGASFAYRAGGPTRISEQQFGYLQQRRELEAYVLYKIRTGLQLRAAVSNALGEDNLGQSRYVDSRSITQSYARNPASPRFQANLEVKF